MGVRALMAALMGSEEPDPDPVSGPTDDLGRLERRVRGPRSGEGGATTLLRDGEARVRVAGPAVAVAVAVAPAAVTEPVRRVTGRRVGCLDWARSGPLDTSSVRRGRLRRRSMVYELRSKKRAAKWI